MVNDRQPAATTEASGGPVEVRRIGADERRLREFLRQTEEVGEGVVTGVQVEIPNAMFEAMTLFSRTLSQIMAVRLLLENGLVEEAMSLSRGLFTDSLRLEYFSAASPEAREALFLYREQEALTSFRERFGNQARSHGVGQLSPEELAEVSRELRKVTERARRVGVVIRKGYPTDQALARRFGRQEDAWFHGLSNEAIHGNQLILRRRASQRAGGIAITTRSYDRIWMLGIGIYSMKAALRSQIFMSGMLGWDPEPATSLLDRVVAWEEALEEREKQTGA